MKTPEGPGKPGLRAKVTKARANSNDSRGDTIRAAGEYRVRSYGGFLIAGWHAHAAVCVGMLAGGANEHAQQTARWACHPRNWHRTRPGRSDFGGRAAERCI
jgi:hypothetical protein